MSTLNKRSQITTGGISSKPMSGEKGSESSGAFDKNFRKNNNRILIEIMQRRIVDTICIASVVAMVACFIFQLQWFSSVLIGIASSQAVWIFCKIRHSIQDTRGYNTGSIKRRLSRLDWNRYACFFDIHLAKDTISVADDSVNLGKTFEFVLCTGCRKPLFNKFTDVELAALMTAQDEGIRKLSKQELHKRKKYEKV